MLLIHLLFYQRRLFMKKMWKRVSILLFTAVLLLSALSVTAYAGTKKVTIRNQGFTTSRAQANKARPVKKGTYKVKLGSKGSGYLKFKAPASKTYTFTVSSLKSKRGSCLGYFYLMDSSNYSNKTYIGQQKVKTQGGKTVALRISDGYRAKRTAKVDQYRSSRYGKLYVPKGSTMFLYFSFYNGASFKLKIK